MKKSGLPLRHELVVCKILKLYPNSAFAELIEYKNTGMIHISEVATRWVKDMRTYLKVNQYVVCKVLRIEGDIIQLSIKRVHREQASSKLNEFKRERKTEKLLELAGKKLKLKNTKEGAEINIFVRIVLSFTSKSRTSETKLSSYSIESSEV